MLNEKMIDQAFEAEIRAALSAVPENQELAHEFLSGRTDIKRYIVGRNEQSSEIIRSFKIDGVIDDYEKIFVEWNGIPIIARSKIPSGSIVVNCSTSISPVAVADNLLKAGINKILSIHELIYTSNGQLSWPFFVTQHREDLQSHILEWNSLYQAMADQGSRQTLLDVVRYRLTADPKYMHGYRVRLIEQYFEDFLELQSEVFVDAGGFDGDTTEEFCRRYPDYRKIYLFEPSVKNIQAAKIRLASFSNIEFLEIGLSDKEEVLHFNPDAGSASAVTNEGGETIKVTTLDNEVDEAVSFIKMDLEGWEMKALAGCAQHIKNSSPKLAIAVYHSASDFREIPHYVLSLNSKYKIYLRHYTQGWSETVMYFVQK